MRIRGRGVCLLADTRASRQSRGYGLQGIGSIFVEKIHGSPSAVIGLPMLETEFMLKHFGTDTWSGRVDRTT